MSIKDTDRKARANYKKKVKKLYIELYPSEEDIKARLEEMNAQGEPTASYIKRLIREDMQKG
jgi:predicted DNA binding CopG/RHH family protein